MSVFLNFVLLAALIVLFFSRIHFTFSLNISRRERPAPNSGRHMATRGQRGGRIHEGGDVRPISHERTMRQLTAEFQPNEMSQRDETQIISALVNLGCNQQKARGVAQRAIRQGSDFDSSLKWALRNAA